MKVVVAGSRTIDNYHAVEQAIEDSGFDVTEVISGTAKGVDSLGIIWAENNEIPVLFFPANWNKYGKRAGYLRNVEMADNADAVIVLWDGRSKGSKHMIDIAKRKNLPLFTKVL